MSVEHGRQRRHGGAVLLILASLLWLHRWVPAFLVVAFVSWIILHKRFEGHRGEALGRRWRRAWPPGTGVLIPLVAASMLGYWLADAPITSKILPVALNVLALSMVLFGNWWTLLARRQRLEGSGAEIGGQRW